MSDTFQSSHNLDFEVAVWVMGPFLQFKIGTCHGLWRVTEKSYDILAINNREKGNGHLNDVFEWFESSCRRDNRNLKVLEVWNKDFKKHLIEKRGFIEIGDENVIKKFRDESRIQQSQPRRTDTSNCHL